MYNNDEIKIVTIGQMLNMRTIHQNELHGNCSKTIGFIRALLNVVEVELLNAVFFEP